MKAIEIINELNIWFFNVGRGISSFILSPNNFSLIYDLGSSSEFSPIDFIDKNLISLSRKNQERPLSQLILSHPHSDHIYEIKEFKNSTISNPCLITCPHTKVLKPDERIDFKRVNNQEHDKNKEKLYKEIYEDRHPPLQTFSINLGVPKDFEYYIFYLRPPIIDSIIHDNNDQDYTNACSIITFFRYAENSILYLGDITPKALEYIFDNDCEKRRTSFFDYNNEERQKTANQKSLLQLIEEYGVTLLVAPHHGLESGFCQRLFDEMKNNRPKLNIILDSRKRHEHHGKIHPYYQSEKGAEGMDVTVDGITEFKRSVSTKNGHHIRIDIRNGPASVTLNKDPEKLI